MALILVAPFIAAAGIVFAIVVVIKNVREVRFGNRLSVAVAEPEAGISGLGERSKLKNSLKGAYAG